MNKSEEIVKKFSEGNLSEEETISSLPPGCKFEKSYEREWRIIPERGGAVQFERVCGRVYDCDDSSNNSDKSCGDWQAL
jgi:hypothetical protein